MDIDKLNRDELNFFVNEHMHIEFVCENCTHMKVCTSRSNRSKNSNLLPVGCSHFYPSFEAVVMAVNTYIRDSIGE